MPESGTAVVSSLMSSWFSSAVTISPQEGSDGTSVLVDPHRGQCVETIMGIQEGIAFGVGLHDGVLHSVVNRFDEVTRTKGTDVSVRLGGGESAQNGQDPGDVSWFSASGESVARLPS